MVIGIVWKRGILYHQLCSSTWQYSACVSMNHSHQGAGQTSNHWAGKCCRSGNCTMVSAMSVYFICYHNNNWVYITFFIIFPCLIRMSSSWFSVALGWEIVHIDSSHLKSTVNKFLRAPCHTEMICSDAPCDQLEAAAEVTVSACCPKQNNQKPIRTGQQSV